MCDYCKATLCLPHTILTCPLKKSLYCSHCSQYGHKTKECSLSYGGVSTYTLPCYEPRYYQSVLDVVNTPHCIRAVISSYGHTPSGRPKQNIVILEEIAEAHGSRLLLHSSK